MTLVANNWKEEMLQLMYVSSKCHLFTSLGYNAHFMLCGINIFFVCVWNIKLKLSYQVGGQVEPWKDIFCTCFVFETYKTCTTLVSDHWLTRKTALLVWWSVALMSRETIVEHVKSKMHSSSVYFKVYVNPMVLSSNLVVDFFRAGSRIDLTC